MIDKVSIIESNEYKFPKIPSSVKLAILLPTFRWTPTARSIIGAMIGVANAEVAVLIADNSENLEKQQFLKQIGRINSNVISIAHEKNIGAANNFYYLLDWSKNIEFTAIMADDDWMSPSYYLDAYKILLENPTANAAESGTTLVDFGDGNLIKANQPSMCGQTPIERIAKWNGFSARVTMYSTSRRATLEAALQFLRTTPLHGMILVEDLFELNRLATGDFLSVSGQGCFVHYPAHDSHSAEAGDSNERYYNLLYKDLGLHYQFIYFAGLTTAILCAMFLMGNCSPIVDPVQKALCGQHVFRHTFVESFLQTFSNASTQAAGVMLFENYPDVRDGFIKYSSPAFSQQPIFDAELIDWFIKLLQVFEEKSARIDLSIAERFSCFVKATAPYDFGVTKSNRLL
ncbi:MAG: hypothetical protein NTW85_07475 [Methylococcales bacterium]|nr:hypothetical protein [Methylococcales bacterium]